MGGIVRALFATTLTASAIGTTALMAPPNVIRLDQPVQPAPQVEYMTVQRVATQVTAFSSSVDETDDTPFISADGQHVYDGLVACPRKYPFGTLARIEGRVYRCGDRLAEKYDYRFDIWKPSKAEAWAYGLRNIEVEIVAIKN